MLILISSKSWQLISRFIAIRWAWPLNARMYGGICSWNLPVTDEFPAQRPMTRSFDVFFDLCLNEQMSEQSRGWWFETPLPPLWRHSNDQTGQANCTVPKTAGTPPLKMLSTKCWPFCLGLNVLTKPCIYKIETTVNKMFREWQHPLLASS